MIKIIDFTNSPLSNRNLSYGGRAGEKRGIIYNDCCWMLKFPKNTSDLHKVKMSYTTSPLSEYIGSNIFRILGYDVHETMLGICNDGKRNKIVCACKDFIKDDKNENLISYTALRNDTSIAVMEKEEYSSSSASNLNEILFQLDKNEVLSKIPNVKAWFWEVAIIDILINNTDRNEDNWGVIKYKQENKYVLAPIFDNGNCFYNKSDEDKISIILKDEARLKSSALNTVTIYENDEGTNIFSKDLLKIKNTELKIAISKVRNNVKNHLEDIKKFINEIPEEYNNNVIISKIRKEYYFKTFKIRFDELLK